MWTGFVGGRTRSIGLFGWKEQMGIDPSFGVEVGELLNGDNMLD
jgi:hypothetical protein